MTDWIDFIVYAALLFALYFAQPTMQQRLVVPLLADRNAQWVTAHPDVVRRIAGSRWRLWLSYALGSVSLGLLASYQLGLWDVPAGDVAVPPWAVLWQLAMGSLVAAIVIGGAVGIWSQLAIKRLVPLAPRRQATLERRSLDDSIPRWLQFGTNGLVAVNLSAWTAAGVLGLYSSPMFWSRLATMFVLSALFFLGTRAMVARRTNVMDRIYGPTYRSWEVRLTFSTQILPPMIGALRLYEEVTATQLLDVSRAMQIALAGFLAFWLLSMSRRPIDPDRTALLQQAGPARARGRTQTGDCNLARTARYGTGPVSGALGRNTNRSPRV